MNNSTFALGGDLGVHRLGFGAMRITGEGIWGWPADREKARRLLRRVLELGINLIDTADAYGPETSEYLIAAALAPYAPGLVIATKGGLTRGGPSDWQTDGRPEHLRRAVENSLRRLELERIELYQFHAIDDDVPLEESLGAIALMQQQGKIRHVGVSNFTVAEIERARKVVDVVSVQNRYNLITRKHEPVLDYCTAHNIGFIPWYPLAVGSLGDDERLIEMAARYEATASQIALAWLLHRSPVMLPIPGTSSIAHLEENAAAGDIRLEQGDFEMLSAIDAF
ncbi:MAG: aldo/keto reductase [Bradymonadaceae bacterium]|nr:aldo/keto reductase [Lujinxingiaceae bacterium]